MTSLHSQVLTNRSFMLILAAVLTLGLFGFAFVAAPASCEWGLSAYFWSGVVVLCVLMGLPFGLRRTDTLALRIRNALLFGMGSIVVWCAGFAASDMRLLCRLF